MKRSGPVRQTNAFDADEVEVRAIESGVASFSYGAYDEVITQEADQIGAELPNSSNKSWEIKEVGTEAIVGATAETVNDRAQKLGDLYPFEIDRGSIRRTSNQFTLYDYCLATSVAASRHEKRYQQLLRNFERVVCDLMIDFVGGRATGIRFGWPSEGDLDNLSSNFSQRVKIMKQRCGFDEDEWKFKQSRFMQRSYETAKDARIDIIVRRCHGDNRIGGFTIIGQCGCGKGDVESSSKKHLELSHNFLKTFFSDSSVPVPTFAFATSQHIVREDDLYNKQSEAASLVFDRIRLCLLGSQHPSTIEKHAQRMHLLASRIFNR